MEQITLTKEECVEQCINKDLKLLDYRVQQILEGVLSESTTYGDARNKLETLKIIAESHFKTEHASVIYKLALKKLDKKINATPIKEWRMKLELYWFYRRRFKSFSIIFIVLYEEHIDWVIKTHYTYMYIVST